MPDNHSESQVIFGFHPVDQALRNQRSTVRAVWVVPRPRSEGLAALAEKRRIPVHRAGAAELDTLCGDANHQGVAALVGEHRYVEIEDLLEAPGAAHAPWLVFLDGVQDPQNLGSIFRSALVLGATGLVIPRDRAASVTPATVRVSAGATEQLPCAQVVNLGRALDQAREAGLWVAGTVEQGGGHPAAVDLTGPLALVLGNEQKGIRPGVLKRCDHLLTLPSGGGTIASLNVAAAAAVFCYEVARQRRASS